MAIIFTPPKRKQRTLFWGIAIFIIFLLVIIFFAVSPPKFLEQEITLQDVAIPSINVNFNILNSKQVNNLEPFLGVELGNEPTGRSEPFKPY